MRCFYCGADGLDVRFHTALASDLTYVLVCDDCHRGKNKACNEIDHPSTQGEIMDETTQTPLEAVVVDETAEVEQNFVTKLAVKHPRAAKIAAITLAGVAAVGVAVTANTVKNNRRHLETASDHAKEALTELASSVSPTDPEA